MNSQLKRFIEWGSEYRWVLGIWTSLLREMGWDSLLVHEGMCPPTWKLYELHNSEMFFFNGGFITESWFIINSSLAPLPFPQDGGGAQFQASNHGLVFLITSPHPQAIKDHSKSYLIKTKDTPIYQEIPRDLGGALCREPKSNIKY